MHTFSEQENKIMAAANFKKLFILMLVSLNFFTGPFA
jgi:hypothetical protein